jgi:arginase
MSKIQRFVNTNELGAGTRGTSLSFEALRMESLNTGFDLGNVFYLFNNNEILFNKLIKQYEYALNIDGILKYYEKNIDILMTEINTSNNQLFFSADHASTGLYLSAFKRLNPESRIGIIWIDAHGDMHSPYTSPSGNMHGMTLNMSLRQDNLEVKKRDIPDEIKAKWKKLQNLSGNEAAIDFKDLVFIGIRDLEYEEEYILTKNNVKHFNMDEIHNEGIESIAKSTLNKLVDCDHIFISFDVDSMDPDEVSFGTGTPVKNGLTLDEAKQLLDILTSSDKKTTFEVVEINPLLDTKNEMSKKTLELLEIVYKNLEK